MRCRKGDNNMMGWYPAARDISSRMYKPPTGTPAETLKYIKYTETLLEHMSVAVVACMTVDEIVKVGRELLIYDSLIHLIKDSIKNFVPPPF